MRATSISRQAASRHRPLALRGGRGADGVVRLQEALHVQLARFGLGKWAKPHTPHVTLLYDNTAAPEQLIDPLSWMVNEFVLVHSLLGKTVHKRVETWRLGPPDA